MCSRNKVKCASLCMASKVIRHSVKNGNMDSAHNNAPMNIYWWPINVHGSITQCADSIFPSFTCFSVQHLVFIFWMLMLLYEALSVFRNMNSTSSLEASRVLYIYPFYCSPPGQECQFSHGREPVRTLLPIKKVSIAWCGLYAMQWAAEADFKLSHFMGTPTQLLHFLSPVEPFVYIQPCELNNIH